MKTQHFSNLEEARRVWQPHYKHILSEVELMEICFNCKSLVGFIVEIQEKRNFEVDLNNE